VAKFSRKKTVIENAQTIKVVHSRYLDSSLQKLYMISKTKTDSQDLSKNMKLTKQINLREGEIAFEMLVAFDYKVEQKNEYHFRINERLDVWPSTKKTYDIKSGRKYQYKDTKDLINYVRKNY